MYDSLPYAFRDRSLRFCRADVTGFPELVIPPPDPARFEGLDRSQGIDERLEGCPRCGGSGFVECDTCLGKAYVVREAAGHAVADMCPKCVAHKKVKLTAPMPDDTSSRWESDSPRVSACTPPNNPSEINPDFTFDDFNNPHRMYLGCLCLVFAGALPAVWWQVLLVLRRILALGNKKSIAGDCRHQLVRTEKVPKGFRYSWRAAISRRARRRRSSVTSVSLSSDFVLREQSAVGCSAISCNMHNIQGRLIRAPLVPPLGCSRTVGSMPEVFLLLSGGRSAA
jgi:hypothetical protein